MPVSNNQQRIQALGYDFRGSQEDAAKFYAPVTRPIRSTGETIIIPPRSAETVNPESTEPRPPVMLGPESGLGWQTRKAKYEADVATYNQGLRDKSNETIAAQSDSTTRLDIARKMASDTANQGLQSEQNQIQQNKIDAESSLREAQANSLTSGADENRAKAAKTMSDLQLRRQYLDPNATEDTRKQIQGLRAAEEAAVGRGGTGLHVIPGKTTSEFVQGQGLVERQGPPQIVDPSTQTYTEASRTMKPSDLPDPPPAESDAYKKLVQGLGTDQQKALEQEWLTRWNSLPKGYKGGK